ncbi:MAG: glycosyltransferase [Alkalispirochaetaceae bacterium]
MISHIGVLTPHYPAPHYPERGAFVERLVRQWSARGVVCDVVAPVGVPMLLRGFSRAAEAMDLAGGQVIYPYHLSFGNKMIAGVNLHRVTQRAFVRAALRGAARLRVPELYYGKFLFRGGEAALEAGERYGRPAFADLGESKSFDRLPGSAKRDAEAIAAGLTGIVTVSERLRDEVLRLGAAPEKVEVIPNDVDTERFRPMDRTEARRRLGLPEEAFIVAFTGHFIERKGPLRVLSAVRSLPGEVYGLFFGRGAQAPEGERVLHAGPVPNEELPVWLNAADLFALPTLAEGHCNAVNEAAACGLPLVTSDIEDLRGQADPSFSLLVDPNDVSQLAEGIQRLREDAELRSRMSEAAAQAFHGGTAASRAEKILDFMEKRC